MPEQWGGQCGWLVLGRCKGQQSLGSASAPSRSQPWAGAGSQHCPTACTSLQPAPAEPRNSPSSPKGCCKALQAQGNKKSQLKSSLGCLLESTLKTSRRRKRNCYQDWNRNGDGDIINGSSGPWQFLPKIPPSSWALHGWTFKGKNVKVILQSGSWILAKLRRS